MTKTKDFLANNMKSVIGVILSAIAFCLFIFLPPESYGLPGLTIVEQRMVAIFITAALLWLTEAIPTWCTSLLVIMVMVIMVSDSSFSPLVSGIPAENLGTLVNHKQILATIADPIVILFLGGFVLAIAVTKTGLDVFMARVLLTPFGKRSEFVLLGFILVTAVFSAFISNTATAAMMLAFLGPVLNVLPPDGKGRVALAMAIPVGANIGGIATPIGTPPNGIALKYINDPSGLNLDISFEDWTMTMAPLTLLFLLISWGVLMWLFPFKQKKIDLKIDGEFKRSRETYIVAATFILTVLVWFTGKINGINANAAAMLPVAILCVTGVISKDDLAQINWSVLFMVAGGFALGLGFQETGLAAHLVSSIPFSSWSPILVLVSSGLICWLLSNFISNSATAALLVPILCSVGLGMGDSLESVGGVRTLLLGVALAASLAMTMPISTPPNAIAHSTGYIKQNDMLKAGLIIGIVCGIIGYLAIIFVM
ncbi:MAG: SLC13/DASS family transporter [Bacteroidales bacterium]|jgi:sodium-dependent dicarboxylate transporter 2/3/5|nr:SLC13/DASS family transporter [Bacteroidales bacterium]